MSRTPPGIPPRRSPLAGLLLLVATAGALLLAVAVVLVPLEMRDQAMFGAVVFAAALVIHRFRGRLATLTLVVVSLMVSSRYLHWRITASLNGDTTLELALGIVLLSAEVYAFVVLALSYLQSVWPLRRRPVPLPADPALWPTVDVFIPTYNEPLAVVRTTVLAAQALDWPADKLNIYVLDDGRRDEFRAFAAAAGVHYLTRDDNKHAKAGNINRALERARGEYVVVFDCDHVPTRSFLQVSMGWMLRDRRLAMMQLPHHFNTPDPFERNLKTFRRVPNEGRLFYGLLQPGNDLWNAVFFCGSCAVLRRTALDEVGGIAVETVTEDAHTALKLHRRGWRTAYLDVAQASGLATESLSAHVGQRIRWARGMVQIFRIDNPLFGRGLRLLQRLCYSNAMIHFLNALPRLVFLTSPLAFLFFDVHIFNGAPVLVLAYALPHLAHVYLTNARMQGGVRHSFWAEVYEAALATYILLPTTLALVNPKLGRFNVTAKGGLVANDWYDRRIARPNLVLLLLNVTGIGLGLWNYHQGHTELDATLINVGWAAYNSLFLAAAAAVALERRQRRTASRLAVELPAMLRLASGHALRCQTRDLAQGGALVTLAGERALPPGSPLHLSLLVEGEEASLPATVVGQTGRDVRLAVEPLPIEQEAALTRAIYSRADAWITWDDGIARDNPLRSLVRVLGHGVRGLFLAIAPSRRSAS